MSAASLGSTARPSTTSATPGGRQPVQPPLSEQSLPAAARSQRGGLSAQGSTNRLQPLDAAEFAGSPQGGCSGNPRLSQEQVDNIKQDKWLAVTKKVEDCTRRTFMDYALSVLACACIDRRSLHP
uniref:Uncharacterized protein n=1 Tax=Alexandrium andersonii TaxID=327968 RepID=A0A7S2GZI2_9DINO|mmetsp:Transcript_65739/g.147593  ORF Transcript_65739/g.147593 Transcript_65739/m.147593 type:complete len:125 (+) Transcript_65739:95-469(+)